MKFSVIQKGKLLPKDKYIWDEKTKTFSTNEENLVLHFSDYDGVTFKTGHFCIFNTGNYCTFNTGNYCNFITGSYCTFTTAHGCNFDAGSDCTFNTGDHCTFNVYEECEFTVGNKCSIIRRDIFQIITPKPGKLFPKPGKLFKLKEYGTKGFWTEEELIIKDIIE